MISEEDQNAKDSRNILTNILCEFLEVAFHLILYVRQVYPVGIFEKRKKYGVPVQMSCHPVLNQYIADTLQGIRPCIENDEVERICVVISDKQYSPMERFVFELGTFVDDNMRLVDSYLFHTEASLRSFLLKISVCDAMLKPNPQDCHFSILVYTKQSAVLKMEQNQEHQTFPWLSVDQREQEVQNSSLVPLKSTTSGLLKMQLFVEESEKK